VIFLAACSGSASPTPTPRSNSPGPPSPPSALGSATPASMSCGTGADVVLNHQAPDIEAVLPPSVAGRSLARWSLRDRCWLEVALTTSADIDSFVAQAETPDDPNRIDLANLAYGVAGRSDTKVDPPFFVYGISRPFADDEVALALYLLFGGAGFHDIEAAMHFSTYEQRTIAGKEVYVGTADMLDQGEHQRGRPYLYQNDHDVFLVITDDDAWAADAIGQLP